MHVQRTLVYADGTNGNINETASSETNVTDRIYIPPTTIFISASGFTAITELEPPALTIQYIREPSTPEFIKTFNLDDN